MKDDEFLASLEITLGEAKAAYALLGAREGPASEACASFRAKLEERLYEVLSLEDMELLARTGEKG